MVKLNQEEKYWDLSVIWVAVTWFLSVEAGRVSFQGLEVKKFYSYEAFDT